MHGEELNAGYKRLEFATADADNRAVNAKEADRITSNHIEITGY